MEKQETVTMPMERYRELLDKEKKANAPRAHTVLWVGKGTWIYDREHVSTDDDAVAAIAETSKARATEIESLKGMNIFQFLKWKCK